MFSHFTNTFVTTLTNAHCHHCAITTIINKFYYHVFLVNLSLYKKQFTCGQHITNSRCRRVFPQLHISKRSHVTSPCLCIPTVAIAVSKNSNLINFKLKVFFFIRYLKTVNKCVFSFDKYFMICDAD